MISTVGWKSLIIYTTLVICTQCIFTIPGLHTQTYRSQGDFHIGASISLRLTGNKTHLCAKVRNNGGAAFIEAIAMRTVNREQKILPNITVGWVFLDDCSWTNMVLARAIEFIPPDPGRCPLDAIPGVPDPFPPNEVVGVIGTGFSSQTISLTSLLGSYKIPVLATLATSDVLNDKDEFPYFARNVPSDMYQARVIVDLLSKFNWTYVNLVASRGSYGEKAAETINTMTDERGICVTYYTVLDDNIIDDAYHNVTNKLMADIKVNVVVMFMYSYQAEKLMKIMNEKNKYNRKFVFIGSDDISWSLFQNYNHMALGSFFIDLYGVPSTDAVLEQIDAENAWSQNPYISHLLQEEYDCSITDPNNLCLTTNTFAKQPHYPKGYYVSAYTGQIMTFINAARLLFDDNCPEVFFSNKTRSMVVECLRSNDLMPYINQWIGLVSPKYQIRQLTPDSSMDNIKTRQIGTWTLKTKTLLLVDELVHWNIKIEKPIESVCAVDCAPKQYRLQMELKCCWECRYCSNNEVLDRNGTRCRQCEEFTWPDANTATFCEPIALTYLNWDSYTTIVIATLAALGALSCLFTFCFNVYHRKTRLIKATCLQLSLITLLGVVIAYPSALMLVIPPTALLCKLSIIGMHLSFCMTYAALLTKANRIYRVFHAASHSAAKPKFISNSFMISVTLILIFMQILVISISYVQYPSSIQRVMPRDNDAFVELMCNLPKESFIPPIGFNIILIFFCSIYAFKTRKLPDNFNESKLIFLHVMATSFLWMAFLPTYFSAVDAIQKASLLAMFLLISSTLALLCLFIPKIYATIYMDENAMKVSKVTATEASTL